VIDLHVHTNKSDGIDSVDEVIEKANKIDLEVISITDHDNIDAYFNLDKEKFNGKIITGCEFTTSYKNILIEILGYGIDYKKVNKFLSEFYTKKFLEYRDNELYEKLKSKIEYLNLTLDISKLSKKNLSLYKLYLELLKDKNNIIKINENVFDTYVNFYRKGIYNPNSKLFLNHIEYTPDLKTILDVIHNSGGKAFLAHPYIYKLSDLYEFLKSLYENNNIDGIECYYTTFTEDETKKLLEFANSKNLLISGGTDYHGKKRKGHELGIGNGNLKILKKTISNWDINYFN